jgi:hypothetical protein
MYICIGNNSDKKRGGYMTNEVKPASQSMTIWSIIIGLLSFLATYVFADKPEIVQLLKALVGLCVAFTGIGMRKGIGKPITFGQKK